MHVLLRQLGEHRGAPRLYLDTAALAKAGFTPGVGIEVHADTDDAARMIVRVVASGSRKVSRKRRGRCEVPVIDINNRQDLRPFEAAGIVRIVIDVGTIYILLPATVRKALARASRLANRLALRQPLVTAGVAFGAGVASGAIHDGLQAEGVESRLLLANEICEDYLDIARRANPVVLDGSHTVAAPMQELAADDWLLRTASAVDVLEAGIPCSGASRAGAAKRRLTRMEDHPHVGHLIGATLQLIGALQPAVVIVENVESYRTSASASILRGWLRDAGYAIAEVVLDASDFGSLETRVRWFLLAFPPGLQLDLAELRPGELAAPALADVLEPFDPDDARYRRVDYLKSKQARDATAGKHFAMQFLDPHATSVPVLRKGYHKGGSTDPRLLHPTDPDRSRLLSAVEHARIKGIDPALIAEVPESTAHQVCGQSVDVRPVRAIGRMLGRALKVFAGQDVSVTCRRRQALASIA
jgi:DNA (cytosine-5)-methyltransferase 1